MKPGRVLSVLGFILILSVSACSMSLPPTSISIPTIPLSVTTLVNSVPLPGQGTLIPLPGQGTLMPVCIPAVLVDTSGLTVDATILDKAYGTIPVIDGVTPTLRWSFDDAACTPTGFVVSIGNLNPDASVNWLIVHLVGPAERAYAVTTADGLQPATKYIWSVHPYVASPMGVDYSTGAKAFFTGPLCVAGSVKAPILVYPADGAVFTDGTTLLSWEYPDACLPHMYEVDRATDSTFTTDLQSDTWPYFIHASDWIGPDSTYLKDCTLYYWKVGASDDGTTFVYSETRSFSMNLHNACSGTATPTPAGLYFTPNLNAYCRSGPDMIFGSSGLAMKGQSYPVDGRNYDNTWLRILLTPQAGCWVPLVDGSPSADTGPVRVLATIPTPTFTPVPFNCGQFTISQGICNAHLQCIFKDGVCVNK